MTQHDNPDRAGRFERLRRNRIAEQLCERWSPTIGPHISSEGGCAMHRAIAQLVLEVDSLDEYLLRYVEQRGIDMPHYDNGSKIVEEAAELQAAVQAKDIEAVMAEAADVAITALVACRQFGFTLEEALEHKIAKDAGRGPKT